jgi:hypothetical protein
MFCPGINFNFDGDLVVTGGDTAPKTSIFDGSAWTWKTAPNMVLGRGYQSSTTLSDGRTFTIGGSWSGGYGGKNGEVFDGSKWTLLNGCSVTPMLTKDPQGIFRQDNHAWLFSWSSGSVFQAGPSVAMNWYYPSSGSSGSWASAGSRSGDGDGMLITQNSVHTLLTAGSRYSNVWAGCYVRCRQNPRCRRFTSLPGCARHCKCPYNHHRQPWLSSDSPDDKLHVPKADLCHINSTTRRKRVHRWRAELRCALLRRKLQHDPGALESEYHEIHADGTTA